MVKKCENLRVEDRYGDEIDPANNVTPGDVNDGDTEAVRKRQGPRGHRGEVRDQIKQAARGAFVEYGYDRSTMREIGRRAGVDSAMVTYYFGSKQRLFRECFDLPSDPAKHILGLLLPDLTTAGERIARYAINLYEEHMTAETMGALMRALMTDAATSQRFRGYMKNDILDRVGPYLGSDPRIAEQIELTMAMGYGVVTMRYIVRLEPLASMSSEDVIAEVAPILQARLDRIIHDFL